VRQRLESLLRAGVVDFPAVGVLAEAPAGDPRGSGAGASSTGTASGSPASRSLRAGAAGSTVSIVRDSVPSESSTEGAARSSVANVAPAASSAAVSRSPHPAAQPLSVDERVAALEVLRSEVCACALCPALVQNRSRTVFGVGNIAPRLCIFGEAPGADEDRQGIPFVGRAGQLLDKILAACTLNRDDVYILNTLKCRPPDNRTPSEDEVENCRGFFERQLQILRPEFICCLGATAAKALLRTTSTLGRLRGRFHDVAGAKVIVTYHPAYLLRNPAAKKDTWEDMKLLMKEMGIALSSE